ncbi:hypothetical protein [Tenacibaculum dicentrarchi]|uniref:hypothetical protein n=1 Tax=Tenacibaculum dicentrarchi TaxID=669041 RepID=UPI003516DD0B
MKYKLSESDFDTIISYSNGLIKESKKIEFNCATMSAVLKAMITDNHNIPAIMFAGHFDYKSKRIFNCKKNIPYDSSKKIINEIWDGHCWIQIADYILDITIVKTMNHKNNNIISSEIIFDKIDNLKNKEIIYTPIFKIEDNQIDSLIKAFISQ